jgi:hypothetical protein
MSPMAAVTSSKSNWILRTAFGNIRSATGLDDIVITAKKHGRIRLSGEEQFISINPRTLSMFTFDPEHSWECGGFVSNSASPSSFKGGDPGHTHPNGSSDPGENVAPKLGPDDGLAAKSSPTGRAYKVSPEGIVRIQRSAQGTYSATLVQGSFGESLASVRGTLSAYNRYNGSVTPGGATASGKSSRQCYKVK